MLNNNRILIEKIGGLVRLIALCLLLLAISGPWGYEVINVPAQFACSPPFVRLEGDFCGKPLIGFWVIWENLSVFMRMLFYSLQGSEDFAGLGRTLLFALPLLLYPIFFINTFSQLVVSAHPKLQIVQKAIWMLGFLSGLVLLQSWRVINRTQGSVWGFGLYFGLLLGMGFVEIAATVLRRRLY